MAVSPHSRQSTRPSMLFQFAQYRTFRPVVTAAMRSEMFQGPRHFLHIGNPALQIDDMRQCHAFDLCAGPAAAPQSQQFRNLLGSKSEAAGTEYKTKYMHVCVGIDTITG